MAVFRKRLCDGSVTDLRFSHPMIDGRFSVACVRQQNVFSVLPVAAVNNFF